MALPSCVSSISSVGVIESASALVKKSASSDVLSVKVVCLNGAKSIPLASRLRAVAMLVKPSLPVKAMI